MKGSLFLKRLALVVSALLVGLILCEVGVRLYLKYLDHRQVEAWQEVANRSSKVSNRPGLGHLIRMAHSHERVYELIPNLKMVFMGHEVRINSLGFRSEEVKPEKDPESLRIIGIGDSRMFGWGVPQEAPYLALLGKRLDQELGTAVEVVNTAVPGYNTWMEVATLEEVGLSLQPDLVLLEIVGNDLALPNFIYPYPDFRATDRSYIMELFRGAKTDRGALEASPLGVNSRGMFEDDPERVPKQYRHMVGRAGLRKALARLKQLSQDHGFEVLVIYGPTGLNEREILEELGLKYYDYHPDILAALKLRGLTFKDYPGSEFTLSAADVHPSPLCHSVIAEAVLKQILERDLVGPRKASTGE